MNTRGLTGMVSSRVADELCVVIYNNSDFSDDGSFTNLPDNFTRWASINALQPIDIQRLQEGGITVKNGISLIIKGAKAKRADKVIARGVTYRVLSWSFVDEYEYDQYDEYDEYDEYGYNRRGTVVTVCDEIQVEAAQ